MIIFYIACCLALLSLLGGVLVLLRAGNKPENRVFFAVSILAGLWSVAFASIELSSNIQLVDFLNKLAYFLGLILLFAGTSFTYYFPKNQPKKSLIIYGLSVLPILFLSFTSLISGTVYIDESGAYIFEFGLLIWAYILAFLVGIVLIIFNGVRTRKQVKGQARSQLDFVMFGYSLSLIFGIGLSVVVPIFNQNTSLDDLAPSSITILILLVSFAIIRHRLFDFRAVLARSFAYLFSTSLIIILYVLLALLLKRLLFPDSVLEGSQLVSNIILLILLVSFYGQIKRIFDKFTNRLFFRDNYDPEALLAKLNQELVTNVELKPLLEKSTEIIKEGLKSSSVIFYLRKTEYSKSRIIDGKTDTEIKNIDKIEYLAAYIGRKIISTEDNTLSEREKSLNKLLRSNNIEVLVKLVDVANSEGRGSGYLLLGSKRSGSSYSNKDLNFLEIIANEFVIAIENILRFEEIKNFNVTLQDEVEDATKRLRSTNAKLKSLDETKDEFISMASHQLRTPLTSVKGYLSMVIEGDAGKITNQQKKLLTQAFTSSQRMNYLISDLLNVSRLKTGKFEIQASPTSLPDVIDGELDQLQETAKTRGLTLRFDRPKTFPVLNLDETKIRQVIMNFIDNAIYYTQPGGNIIIQLEAMPKTVEFRVVDNGLGVPKKDHHNLFNKFYRAENARRARPDGTGLGLFMAKKVVIAQGGAIIFKSQEGKGSTFGFTFPIEKLEVKT